MLARKMHQAEQNLSLTKEQLQEARDALLHVKTRPGKFRLARQLGDLIDGMQNDSLRAPNQDILVPAETQDLELLLTNSSGAQVSSNTGDWHWLLLTTCHVPWHPSLFVTCCTRAGWMHHCDVALSKRLVQQKCWVMISFFVGLVPSPIWYATTSVPSGLCAQDTAETICIERLTYIEHKHIDMTCAEIASEATGLLPIFRL